MKVNDVFSNKYLSASDLDDETPTHVTIEEVKKIDFDEGPKFEIKFRELKKSLIANRTNSLAISKLLGPDTDDWEGQRISLFVTQVDYKGEQVDAIRVKKKLPRETADPVQPASRPAAQSQAQPASRPPASVAAPRPDREEDDIPF